jgi:hypothetical protein
VWYGRRKPVFKHLGVLLLIGLGYLGLTHARSTPIWQQISLLEWLQFPWRFLAPASFVFALAAGSIVAWKPKLGWKPIWLIVIPLIIFNRSYHQPTDWFPMTDQIKFSGELWEKQLTISIFDYLPIAAEHPPTHKAPEQPWFVVGTGQILTYHKTASRQWGQVESTTSASLRLPLYDFPGMQARVNNQIVSIDNHNELGLITIDSPPGSSQIEAKLTDTPIRKTGNIISLLSWVILLSWLSWVHLIQPAIKRLSLNIKPPHKHQTGQH